MLYPSKSHVNHRANSRESCESIDRHSAATWRSTAQHDTVSIHSPCSRAVSASTVAGTTATSTRVKFIHLARPSSLPPRCLNVRLEALVEVEDANDGICYGDKQQDDGQDGESCE